MKTPPSLKALLLTLGLLTTATTWAATAAFTGKVTVVKKAEAKQKDTLVHFTAEIDYFDYLSRRRWSPFQSGRHERPAGSQARIGVRDRRSHGECSHFLQGHPAGPVGLFLRDNLA